jgi:hypothetical protein
LTDRYSVKQFKKRSNSNIGKGSGLAASLTPKAYKRNMDSSIDIAQKRMDDMMLFNSQKQQRSFLSNERQRRSS